jgi:RimJ/RimL family protein N-acetyltransferase
VVAIHERCQEWLWVLSKNALPVEIRTARTIVRRARGQDLRAIAAWPGYPWPYDVFDMVGSAAQRPDGTYWWEHIDEPDRCQYSVVSSENGEIIGVHSLARIDRAARRVGNMGVRIRSDVCDQGYGIETLGALLAATLDSFAQSIRLDVAAPNARAIRCYERCGMQIVDEFWRDHHGEPIDPDAPKWSFALPHIRRQQGKWVVRFYWMEIRRGPNRECGRVMGEA